VDGISIIIGRLSVPWSVSYAKSVGQD